MEDKAADGKHKYFSYIRGTLTSPRVQECVKKPVSKSKKSQTQLECQLTKALNQLIDFINQLIFTYMAPS